jgi:hypothetical protein
MDLESLASVEAHSSSPGLSNLSDTFLSLVQNTVFADAADKLGVTVTKALQQTRLGNPDDGVSPEARPSCPAKAAEVPVPAETQWPTRRRTTRHRTLDFRQTPGPRFLDTDLG